MELDAEKYIDLKNGVFIPDCKPRFKWCDRCEKEAIGRYLFRLEAPEEKIRVFEQGWGINVFPTRVWFEDRDCCVDCAPKDVPVMRLKLAKLLTKAFAEYYYGFPIDSFRLHEEDGKFYCLSCCKNLATRGRRIKPCNECTQKYFC